MLRIRKADERGKGITDWLESAHTFSFADYYDPNHLHFSHLRVINEDFIAPGRGFGKHPHDNMEILTYVLSGRVAHEDSMGNRTEVKAGEFQIMSAGSGIFHSEVNPSRDETLHLYQIWIIPDEKNITPRYSQDKFAAREGGTLILSPQAEDGSFRVYQDMKLWRYQYGAHKAAKIALNSDRSFWLQMVKGVLTVNNAELRSGDALAVRDERALDIRTTDETEFLLFDLV